MPSLGSAANSSAVRRRGTADIAHLPYRLPMRVAWWIGPANRNRLHYVMRWAVMHDHATSRGWAGTGRAVHWPGLTFTAKARIYNRLRMYGFVAVAYVAPTPLARLWRSAQPALTGWLGVSGDRKAGG